MMTSEQKSEHMKKMWQDPVIRAKLMTSKRRPREELRAFDDETVRLIRKRYENGDTQCALAKEYGVSQPVISLLINRKTYAEIV